MSTYPPNQTTPKSGNYLWNWLGSPLKKFAAALAPYLGDGYSYKEIEITSAELLNPPDTFPDGFTGKQLLPVLPVGQFYDWYLYAEFIPGSTAYTTAGTIGLTMLPSSNTSDFYSTGSFLTANTPVVWQTSTRGAEYSFASLSGAYLNAHWTGANFADGNGTMKVKLWYKVVNFG